MGRKTFESIGRPLPGRRNVVVSRRSGYAPEGVEVTSSLDEALALFPESEEVFVTGGGEIYAQAMPKADRMYLTLVEHDYEGDTRFPEWNRDDWEVAFSERHECGREYPYPFQFMDLLRRR